MSLSIVFIDDEPLLCRIFALALQRHGHKITTFTNPIKALEHIAASPPNVVVCDYRMPGMTGLEVLSSLPEDMPFVLFSGDLSANEALSGRRGMLACISKPVRPDELINKVLSMVST